MTNPVRLHTQQQVHFLRLAVAFNTGGIATGVKFKNALPANSMITGVFVRILTAFNAATTNVLTVGQNASSYNDMVNAGDVDETVAATTAVTRGIGLVLTSDTDVTVMYTQTGTAATTGSAEVTIQFCPNIDG